MIATPTRIKLFKGEFRFLSNFYPAEVYHDGITYPTVEYIGQLSSTLHLDPEETGEIVDGLNEKLEEALVEGG